MALPESPQRRARRLRCRNAAAAAGIRLRSLSRWSCQQLGIGRQEPDDPVQPSRLWYDAGRGPMVQGTAVALDNGALELRGPEGLRRRLLLDGPGTAAGGMG